MEIGKIVANRGVKRNKRPRQNIIYWIEIVSEEKLSGICGGRIQEYEQYKFKNEGYLWLNWQYQRDWNKGSAGGVNIYGFISFELLKSKLTPGQYSKFCQGEREFIVQRRQNGQNI